MSCLFTRQRVENKQYFRVATKFIIFVRDCICDVLINFRYVQFHDSDSTELSFGRQHVEKCYVEKLYNINVETIRAVCRVASLRHSRKERFPKVARQCDTAERRKKKKESEGARIVFFGVTCYYRVTFGASIAAIAQ